MTRRLWEAIRRKHEIRLYQWIAVLLAIAATWAVGIAGTARYVSDQRAESARDAAMAIYSAARASYENSRDERSSCIAAVATRDDLRGVLSGLIAAIEAAAPDPSPAAQVLLDNLHPLLEKNYPPRLLSDCPPEPTPPRAPILIYVD